MGCQIWDSNIKRFRFKGQNCIYAKLVREVGNGWVVFLNSADENGVYVSKILFNAMP